MSDRDEGLLRLQRAIAEHKGYTHLLVGASGALSGVLHADEGPTLVPDWPRDRSAAFELVDEMEAAGKALWEMRNLPHSGSRYFALSLGEVGVELFCGSLPEGISRLYAAWKGIEVGS